MKGGDTHILRRGIDAGDGRTQPRHRFAQEPAAADAVEQRQAGQRGPRQGHALHVPGGAVADVADAYGIEPVQRLELAGRVPPFGGDARKALDLAWIDGGLSRFAHGSLLLTRMVPPVSIPRFRAGPWRASFSNSA